jgi:tRNA-dihydrouridine synthase
MLLHYGIDLGSKAARKHLGWYVAGLRAQAYLNDEQTRNWRQILVSNDSPGATKDAISRLYGTIENLERDAA